MRDSLISPSEAGAAKQLIDIFGFPKDKAKGILSKDKQALLDSVSFNLHISASRLWKVKNKNGG